MKTLNYAQLVILRSSWYSSYSFHYQVRKNLSGKHLKAAKSAVISSLQSDLINKKDVGMEEWFYVRFPALCTHNHDVSGMVCMNFSVVNSRNFFYAVKVV